MRHFGAKQRSNRGQVALEYILAIVIVAGAAGTSWLFTQGFVMGNLHGGQELSSIHSGDDWSWTSGMASFGLDKTAALPFP